MSRKEKTAREPKEEKLSGAERRAMKKADKEMAKAAKKGIVEDPIAKPVPEKPEKVSKRQAKKAEKEALKDAAKEARAKEQSEKTAKKDAKKAAREEKKNKPSKWEQLSEDTRDTIKSVGKYAAQGSVVLALLVVCTISAVAKYQTKNRTNGVMMTLEDVSDGVEPFGGNTFTATPIAYDDMLNHNYETAKMKELEELDAQIDAALEERRLAREAKERQEVAQVIEAPGISEYEPDKIQVITPKPAVTTTYTTPLPGTTAVTVADENGTYQSLGTFVLTAYCPCPICCGSYSNMENPTTSTGTRATAGRTIAVDPSRIPYGTKVKINGQIYVAEDTGGAIVGNRIDVYFNTHQEALNFGRQSAEVFKVIE